MKKIDKIIKESIDKVVREKNMMLSEANNNLTFREFNSDMAKMGLTYREETPSGKKITIHVHDDGGQIKADALRQVKDKLERMGWFNDKNNFKLFPFQKWQFSPESITVDRIQDEIEAANEEFKDAEVNRVFSDTDNPLCVMEIGKKFNLCRSIDDRRPLLDIWFDAIDYNGENGTPRMRLDNWETVETECYPIKPDGTLDTENVIIENKSYGKKRL